MPWIISAILVEPNAGDFDTIRIYRWNRHYAMSLKSTTLNITLAAVKVNTYLEKLTGAN